MNKRPNYQALLNEALFGIVKSLLNEMRSGEMDEEVAFYISFRTHFHGVVLSERMKLRYPKEMTIVLQHQFKNLLVLEECFSVNISFDGIQENVVIPFGAITDFFDPIVNFKLRFSNIEVPQQNKIGQKSDLLNNRTTKAQEKPCQLEYIKDQQRPKTSATSEKNNKEGELVSFSKFRNKRDNNTKK